MRIEEEIKIVGRTYLSISHIRSASSFARQAYQIEKNLNGNPSETIFFEHRSYATGAILFSIFFLEALINEFFEDSVFYKKSFDDSIKQIVLDRFSESWKLGIDKYDILKKYELALILADKSSFDRGTKTYQNISLLIKLRNSLVHYKPKSVPLNNRFESKGFTRFENELKEKFEHNPLTGTGNSFFPDKCLGSGCAKWAVGSSLSFSKKFYSKMGLDVPYQHVVKHLKIP